VPSKKKEEGRRRRGKRRMGRRRRGRRRRRRKRRGRSLFWKFQIAILRRVETCILI
jgi:hypothetical protein